MRPVVGLDPSLTGLGLACPDCEDGYRTLPPITPDTRTTRTEKCATCEGAGRLPTEVES